MDLIPASIQPEYDLGNENYYTPGKVSHVRVVIFVANRIGDPRNRILNTRPDEIVCWPNHCLGRLQRVRQGTTRPPSGIKSPFPVPLICYGARQNPATCGINQRARKRRFAPTLRAGGTTRECWSTQFTTSETSFKRDFPTIGHVAHRNSVNPGTRLVQTLKLYIFK
jgi:hypothetical protein